MMRDRMDQMACAQILCEGKNISFLEVLQSSVDGFVPIEPIN